MPALVALLFGGLLWFALRSDQPTYNGKSLLRWLLQHAKSTEPGDQRSRAEAEIAIQKIGTNALPTLLLWISKRDHPLKKKVRAVLGERVSQRINLQRASDYHALTTYTCGVLKSLAKPIVPDLAALLRDPDPSIRSSAAYALARIGPSAEEAIPALLESLADSEAIANAMQALKDIGVKADVIVPISMRHLSSTNRNEQMCAMWALAQCGTNAKVAVTNVMQFLSDPDLGIRMSATNALNRIDPRTGTGPVVP
jgi:hypothetical protein